MNCFGMSIFIVNNVILNFKIKLIDFFSTFYSRYDDEEDAMPAPPRPDWCLGKIKKK